MSDFADISRTTSDAWEADALAAHARRRDSAAALATTLPAAGERHCITCDQLVEPERIRCVPEAERCAHCAGVHERRSPK